jgi:Elongation factor G C-terminus
MESTEILSLRLRLNADTLRFGGGGAATIRTVLADAGVRFESVSGGLVLLGTRESDLIRAADLLRERVPDLKTGNIEVVFLEDPEPSEPYLRVRAISPEDYYGDVIADLNTRYGQIEALEDTAAGKLVVATAPLVGFLGWDVVMRRITQGRRSATYEYLGYRPTWPRSEPPNPRGPAVAKRA